MNQQQTPCLSYRLGVRPPASIGSSSHSSGNSSPLYVKPSIMVEFRITNRNYPAHSVPMVRQILSHGQDLNSVYFQHPRQDWLGYYGSTWLPYTPVLDVLSTEAGGD